MAEITVSKSLNIQSVYLHALAIMRHLLSVLVISYGHDEDMNSLSAAEAWY